ncbi:MAG: hypothetical protein SVU94_06840, partial [Bacteroidota bacterium]|nr:hypothetical protein [Bacteroidota bacterium]
MKEQVVAWILMSMISTIINLVVWDDKENKIVDRKIFLEEDQGDVAKIDQLIKDIESNYKFPILLK